MLDTIPIN
jgi:hypothetical protein